MTVARCRNLHQSAPVVSMRPEAARCSVRDRDLLIAGLVGDLPGGIDFVQPPMDQAGLIGLLHALEKALAVIEITHRKAGEAVGRDARRE